MQTVMEVRTGAHVDDDYLHNLYNSIYQFYQNQR